MQKLIIAASVAFVTSSFISPSYALNTEHKQELSFGGSAIVGALLGGPVGYVVGAIGGAYMAEQIKQTDESAAELALLHQQYGVLSQTAAATEMALTKSSLDVETLKQSLLKQAQTPVFFATGADQLSVQELEKLSKTIALLRSDDSIDIALHGYADPRGTDGYNLVLSEYRAIAVKQALMANGVDEARISVEGRGVRTMANTSDAKTYALARRVDISVVGNEQDALVMQ